MTQKHQSPQGGVRNGLANGQGLDDGPVFPCLPPFDDGTALVGAHVLVQRTGVHQPATDEIAAGFLWTILIDGAAGLGAVLAGDARAHTPALDDTRHPTFATGRAVSTFTIVHGLKVPPIVRRVE